MKKYLITVTAILCVLCAVLSLSACQKVPAEQEESHISYMQQAFYLGKTKDFTTRLVMGVSEAMFVADGKTTDVRSFATLTVVPQHVDLFNEAYDYTLKGDKGEISGALDKDSFGASYSAAISDLAAIGTPVEVTVKSNKIEESIPLADMLSESITGVKALEIAEAQLTDKLTASDKEREIYVKYINDAESDASDYYWYVAFIASPTDYYAVLVAPDGKIVSVNP